LAADPINSVQPARSTLTGGAIIYEAVSSKPPAKPSLREGSATTAQPLLLGARVRIRGRDATGVIIGNSSDSDRVRVRWDDTSEVTHCLRRKLGLVR
jgi:hypothetical protein